MGSIGVKELKELLDLSRPAQGQTPPQQPPPQGQWGPQQWNPQQGYQGYQGSYPYPPPPMYDHRPPRDTKADEREKELRETVEALRKQNEVFLQRMAEKEREAEAARHRAELDAQKSAFQSVLESMRSKMESLEAKISAPPPVQQHGTDFTTTVVTALPHLKDIFTANKESETEKYRLRELELQKERERMEREARERHDQMEREARERHDAFTREIERQREDTKHTLEMYRLMGEQAKESSRAISEFVAKQNDPSGTMSVIKMAAEQSTQQMQLLATLVKTGLLGGSQSSGVDWGDLAARGFSMLGEVGSAFAAASEAKAKAAAQIAAQQAAQLPYPQPEFSGTPAGGTDPTQQPIRVPRAPARPAPEEEKSPLEPFIENINQSILAQEEPSEVASKLASLVRLATDFSGGKKPEGALRKLMENPEEFLLQSYTTKKYANTPREYLIAIADFLMAEFGPDDDSNTSEGDTDASADEGDSDESKSRPVHTDAPPATATPAPPVAPPAAATPPVPGNGNGEAQASPATPSPPPSPEVLPPRPRRGRPPKQRMMPLVTDVTAPPVSTPAATAPPEVTPPPPNEASS